MNIQEMKASSNEKIQKIRALMESLNMSVEARQKLMPSGFIDNVVIFVDNEKYPQDPVPAPAETPAQP